MSNEHERYGEADDRWQERRDPAPPSTAPRVVTTPLRGDPLTGITVRTTSEVVAVPGMLPVAPGTTETTHVEARGVVVDVRPTGDGHVVLCVDCGGHTLELTTSEPDLVRAVSPMVRASDTSRLAKASMAAAAPRGMGAPYPLDPAPAPLRSR